MHQRGMFAPLGHSYHWGDYLRNHVSMFVAAIICATLLLCVVLFGRWMLRAPTLEAVRALNSEPRRAKRSSAHRGFPSVQDRPAQTQPAPDRGLDLDLGWIGVPHFAARMVELVLLGCKVERRERALGVDENSAPLLWHLLKLLRQLPLSCVAHGAVAGHDHRERLI